MINEPKYSFFITHFTKIFVLHQNKILLGNLNKSKLKYKLPIKTSHFCCRL